jgi:DNA processing protein
MNAAAPARLDQDEAFARIRLLRSPNIGPVSYFQLLHRFANAQAALAALPDLAARGGGRYQIASATRIEEEIAAVRASGARYLFHDAPDYPDALAALEVPPALLIMRGDGALLRQPAVGLVGARNASAGAVKLAREFAADLAGRGYAVVSGLARGIDAAAHKGALAGMALGGGTVGVIASGIDIAYPPENTALQEEVATRGLLIAEMPPGTQPLARHFPVRNRIIAGLCAGTVVVEAAPRSGSLITARLAGEAGREVMAVPGSPLDSRSRGCNQLIRDGAVLVQSADDVAELLERFDGTARQSFGASFGATFRESALPEYEPNETPADIAGLLGAAPISIDELIRQSGAPSSAVQMALLELELAGGLERHAGGRVSLVV